MGGKQGYFTRYVRYNLATDVQMHVLTLNRHVDWHDSRTERHSTLCSCEDVLSEHCNVLVVL